MEIEGKTEKEFSPVPGPSTNKKVRKELLPFLDCQSLSIDK